MANPQTQAPGRPVAPPITTVTEAREVVSVACKLPNGFILREFKPAQESELVLGGGARDLTVHRETGRQVEVKGVAYRFGMAPPILVNGYRVTPNVPKDLWDGWLEANRDSDLVRNRIVFADVQDSEIKARTRESEAVPTGFEGIDPDDPGKRVRGIVRAEKPK